MNSEAHAHKLENNMAEANARLAELERTAKIHLTGENTHMDGHKPFVFPVYSC